MADQIDQFRNNSNRKKIIVAVLLIIFVVVVGWRPSNSASDAVTGVTGVCASSPPIPMQNLPTTVKSSPVEPSILPLPKVDFQKVLELDPFRSRPKSESQADAEREVIESESNVGLSAMASSTAVPSEVPQVEIPISAIVTGGKRSAALIGDRLFYENDLLENGWLIVAIRRNSVLVERSGE